jgi:hypothetical protein
MFHEEFSGTASLKDTCTLPYASLLTRPINIPIDEDDSKLYKREVSLTSEESGEKTEDMSVRI